MKAKVKIVKKGKNFHLYILTEYMNRLTRINSEYHLSADICNEGVSEYWGYGVGDYRHRGIDWVSNLEAAKKVGQYYADVCKLIEEQETELATQTNEIVIM